MTTRSDLTDTDLRQIRELVDTATQAQSDPDLLPALHTPEAVVVNFGGRRILGRDAFADAMTAALSSPLRDVSTEVEITDIRPVSDSVVLVSCLKTVRDRRDPAQNEELPASVGALSYLLSRTGDGWRIALAQTTPILS